MIAAPFPWFGGKRKVAGEVWQRFGAVDNYVEPFFGSGAVLLGRPAPFSGNETINDLDGFVANFWRSIQHDPEATARHADNPVNENDLHARHAWLVAQTDTLRARLEGDPDFFDAKIAGWWVWGISCWIGSRWCSGKGPWRVVEGRLVRAKGDKGRGVARQRPHLMGQGVNRETIAASGLLPWFRALAARLARVRVASGDWSRVCGPTATFIIGTTGIFLDPPYSDAAKRDRMLYSTDSLSVAHAVREWAIENGKRKDMRIALCGYEGEHDMPAEWSVFAWQPQGGFETQAAEEDRTGNRTKERIWFSPHCLSARQRSLFDHHADAGGAR